MIVVGQERSEGGCGGWWLVHFITSLAVGRDIGPQTAKQSSRDRGAGGDNDGKCI